MRVLNFAHLLTRANLKEIEALCGRPVSQVIDVPSQIDPYQPLEPQVEAMLDALGLAPKEWESEPPLVNPPSLASSAVVLLAQLHGRLGYFPSVLRLRRDSEDPVPRFVVAEVLNLQAIRERARNKRAW